MFKNFGDRIALVDENRGEVTYDQLFAEAQELYDHIGHRCLAFILCENTTQSVAGYVSFINNRVVTLLLSSKLEEELLHYLLKTYEPEYIWTPQERSGELLDFLGEKASCIYQKELYTLVSTGYEPAVLHDDLCLLLTTSGSTGSPKLVRQSYVNLQSNTESIVEYLELTDSERAITTLPMNYTYGLSILNTHLYIGAALLLTEKTLMQKEFWEFFKAEEATSFGGVPYTYEMLNRLRFFQMDLPSLRYMTQAGGKLTPDLHRKYAEYCQEKGKKFIVMYGQTEASPRMGYLPAEKSLEKYGSMGIAIPRGRFELWDINNHVITEPGVVGELVYYGDNVTLGYALEKADLAKGDERGGILETGDMARFDEDGYFFIVGRKKRFLKIFGNRVNLDETERLIKQAYPDLDVACGGVDDKMKVYITDENKKEEVRRFISGKTKLNLSAFDIVVIDEIPKNDSGKILYKDLP